MNAYGYVYQNPLYWTDSLGLNPRRFLTGRYGLYRLAKEPARFAKDVYRALRNKFGRSRIDDLLNAGKQADKNGLTRAGRALQKHGDRTNSAFPKSCGNAASRNKQGQDILEGILKGGNQSKVPNRFGGKDIYNNLTGRGARFDGTGKFKGFLEP